MKVYDKGVIISGMYRTASPGTDVTVFTDSDGARVFIDTKTLVYLYELAKFDLERLSGKTMDELFPREVKCE